VTNADSKVIREAPNGETMTRNFATLTFAGGFECRCDGERLEARVADGPWAWVVLPKQDDASDVYGETMTRPEWLTPVVWMDRDELRRLYPEQPMTRPIDETWSTNDGDVLTGPAEGCERLSYIRHASWGPGDVEARARLAAQAPAMARLLLEMEWGGSCDCPSCHRCQYDDKPEDTHAPDCELVAVLRSAGVYSE
jgi:hypothetical protein